MPRTTITGREFNQHVGRAKRESHAGPVVITDRGKPAYVLMTIEDYRSMSGTAGDIVNLLSMPDADEIAFDPPRLSDTILRPATIEPVAGKV